MLPLSTYRCLWRPRTQWPVWIRTLPRRYAISHQSSGTPTRSSGNMKNEEIDRFECELATIKAKLWVEVHNLHCFDCGRPVPARVGCFPACFWRHNIGRPIVMV